MAVWGEVLQLLLQGCSGTWLVQPCCAHLKSRKFFRLESHQRKEFTPALEWCLVDPLETENSATGGLPPSFTSFFYFCCLENSFSFASTPFRSPCSGGCCARSGSVGTPSSWAAGAWQAWAGVRGTAEILLLKQPNGFACHLVSFRDL